MTNESSRIISEVDCLRCGGKCCESFEIAYPNPPRHKMTNDDAIWRSEMDRFEMLKGMKDKITRRDEGDVTWLIFHISCKYLLSNGICEIYDNPIRPLLCRRFPHPTTTRESCPKVRQ